MKKLILYLFYSLATLFLLGCNRLDMIDYNPKITPDAFLNAQHWMKIQFGSSSFILSQPLSSFIVYFVSLFDIFVAYKFLSKQENQKSKLWWGIGLFLTGAGALFAGTSYQAFGYEIKCSGREFCTWTSWWEIIYMLFSGPGMCAFLIASAYSNTKGNLRKGIIVYAAINAVLYSTLLLYGAFVPIQFLVSFEFLMAASTPSVIFFVWIYGRSYSKNRDKMSLALRNTWIILILVMVTYIAYLLSGITQVLWSKGIWFTENDILHVGMIYWVYYILKNLPERVKDLE